MANVTHQELLEAGVHYGHLRKKWNPGMAPYIFMEKNGIHIIDLNKTIAKLNEATAAKFEGLGPEQLLVYQVCERAGNK